MAFADFTLVFSDPEIVSRFIVQRRSSSQDANGRVQPTVVATYGGKNGERPWPSGVVTGASPDQLQRLPDQEHQQKALSISTRFRLQGPRPGQQPDYIIWRGDTFVVITIDDFSNFGPGFITALVQRIDATSASANTPQVAN